MAGSKTYDMTAYPVQVAVRSESDATTAYMVHLPYCPCTDFINRRGEVTEDRTAVTVCKHLLQALERVGGWHRPEPEPEPDEVHADVSRDWAAYVLTRAGVSGVLADGALDSVVAGGSPTQVLRPGKPAIRLTARRASAVGALYTLTIPR